MRKMAIDIAEPVIIFSKSGCFFRKFAILSKQFKVWQGDISAAVTKWRPIWEFQKLDYSRWRLRV